MTIIRIQTFTSFIFLIPALKKPSQDHTWRPAFRSGYILCVFCFVLALPGFGQPNPVPGQFLSGDSITEYLLMQLKTHRLLVIPECLSHDSYDAIQLPLKLIKTWTEKENHPGRLLIGLENNAFEQEFAATLDDRFHSIDRYATICPEAWGLFSTRRLNAYLFYKLRMESNPRGYTFFGFENNFHYFDSLNSKYLLPSDVSSDQDEYLKVPFTESSAPMVIKYAYSRFFRDYLSFKSIEEMLNQNPDAYCIIIVGNAHTLRNRTWTETDLQIISAYNIDTTKYSRPLGFYLKNAFDPVFIQSSTEQGLESPALYAKGHPSINAAMSASFYTDYLYVIPENEETNLEEPPFLAIPSASNLHLLAQRNFQIYPDSEYFEIARVLVHLFTGISPSILEDFPGQTGSCTFLLPETKDTLQLMAYTDSVLMWYQDGTYLDRIEGNLTSFNHRSLFAGIFRLMGKEEFFGFTPSERIEFENHLLAVLSVIGTDKEREYARRQLENEEEAETGDYYAHFRRYFSRRYFED